MKGDEVAVTHATIVVVRWEKTGFRPVVTQENGKEFTRFIEAAGRTIYDNCPFLEDYLNQGGWESIELAGLGDGSWIGVVSKRDG